MHDLRAEGFDVAVVEPNAEAVEREPDAIVGLGEDPDVLVAAGIERAAGFIAGTDNDTTNLSLVAAARSANPDLFVAARQNKQASAPLFTAVEVDALLVPAEVVAHEVYAQLATPLLWRFIREMPACGNDWADSLIGKLTHLCGKRLQSIWRVQLNTSAPGAARHGRPDAPAGGPAAQPRRPRGAAVGGRVAGRARGRVPPRAARRLPLAADDELLLVGAPSARRLLDSTLLVDAIREYVLRGRHVPTSWVWRAITGRRA